MTFGPAVGNVGMYVAREMLISVPEDQRQAYLRMVEEISDLKYQLGVEVARQLPRLLAEHDPERVARYLRPGQARSPPPAGRAASRWPSSCPTSTTRPTSTLAERLRRHRLPGHRRPARGHRDRPAGRPSSTASSASCARWSPRSSAPRSCAPSWPPATGATRSGASTPSSWPRRCRRSSPGCARATGPPTSTRCARWPPPTPRPRSRPPTPCSTCSTASASRPRAPPSGSTAAWRCSSATRRSGAATSAWAPSTALQVLEELKEGLALKSVARVLKLYATALSGHEVAIRGTNELQAVDAFGADHIILPPEMHFFEDDDGNFTAYKVADRPRRRAHRVRHLRVLARPTSPRPSSACAPATPRWPA